MRLHATCAALTLQRAETVCSRAPTKVHEQLLQTHASLALPNPHAGSQTNFTNNQAQGGAG